MKTKVICAALLAMFAIGMTAQANTLTAGKKAVVVAKHKAVTKKKAVKPAKQTKKTKGAKAGKKTAATAKPTK